MESDRLTKIHSTGYWRVNIRPARQVSDSTSTLTKCREIVRSSAVELRGWDYPHWDEREVRNGQNWVEGGCDWAGYIEYWRYYQSGQFIHHFAMTEDYDQQPSAGTAKKREAPPFLYITSTLYTLTEIYEFATRLAAKEALGLGALVSITLFGTEGRELIAEPGRWPVRSYVCQLPKIEYNAHPTTADLLSGAGNLAVEAAVYLFERFNWTNPPKSLFTQEQAKLLEGRL